MLDIFNFQMQKIIFYFLFLWVNFRILVSIQFFCLHSKNHIIKREDESSCSHLNATDARKYISVDNLRYQKMSCDVIKKEAS